MHENNILSSNRGSIRIYIIIQLTYNNSFQSSIGITPYEAVLYERPCRSPICYIRVGKSSIIGPELIYESMKRVKVIHD